MFDADRPIINSSEDKLNRYVFAKYLARCMLNHVEDESLTIGLNGDWGVGKTSLINLINEELDFASSNMIENDQPVILNFNPWNYAGQKELVYNFFRRLISDISEDKYFKNKDEMIHTVELYSSFFSEKLTPILEKKKKSFWKKIFGRSKDSEHAWHSGKDLTTLKDEINSLLTASDKKIIVIIDNISQLEPEEIKRIFQIAKTIANFSNTIFLLSYNKKQVIHALHKLHEYKPQEYLEKIIQLSFGVPPISLHELGNLFDSRMSEIIGMVPSDYWDKEYWADVYYGNLKYFFTNCRDITRYINTLNFGYTHLRDVVNPVDFFAITAIEVFIPDVYKAIQQNKDLFSDLLDNVYEFTNIEIQKDKTRCDEVLEKNNRIPAEILLDLLMRLFPRIRHIYQPGVPFYHSDAAARKLRRICSPDLFDLYFRLSMPSMNISDHEFETIISMANKPEELDHALARLNQDDRSLDFLDHLDEKTIQNIPNEHIQAIIDTLIDNGDLFPQGTDSPLLLDTAIHIHRILHYLLKRFNDSEDRFILMQNAISKASKSIYTIVHELQEQVREHSEESDTFLPLEFRDFLPDQLASLQKLAVNQIQNWANTSRLQDHPQILSILNAWRDWGDADACRKYVKQLTDTDRGLIAFLTAALNPAINESMSDYEKNPLWESYLTEIDSFISVKKLEQHAKELFEDPYFEKLREKEQLALMIFLDLIKAKTRKDIPGTSV